MIHRIALLAVYDDTIILIDAKDVISPASLSLYARDLTHPAPAGSALISQSIPQAIAAQPTR